MSEYDFDHGPSGGYGYEEGIDPGDEFAQGQYGSEPVGYAEQQALAEVEAQLEAYIQQKFSEAAAPMYEYMEHQAHRDGEERISEILADFESETGRELDDETRVRAWEAGDQFIEAAQREPWLMDLAFEEINSLPELRAAVEHELTAKGLWENGQQAIFQTAAFAEHLLRVMASVMTEAPAGSEMDVVNRYFPGSPRRLPASDGAAGRSLPSPLARV